MPSALLSNVGLEKPTPSNQNEPRLKSPVRARSIAMLLVEADKSRAEVLARVKGMLDGNSPFSQAALVANGQGNRTNVNFREGEAMLSSAETPYYDLFAESTTYCRVEIDEPDPAKRNAYSTKVTLRFDEMLKDWAGFDYNIQQIIHEMVAFGRGVCLWQDHDNWRFSAVQQSKVLVPNGTPADPDALELLVVRQAMTVSNLWGKIKNEDAAKAAGWSTKKALECINAAVPQTTNDAGHRDQVLLQEMVRNHDLYESVRSDVILVSNIFVREFDGTVSHLIVDERNPTDSRVAGSASSSTNSTEGEGEFLYKSIGKYKSFRECVGTFFYDIGDGTWHSVKGLGVKLYPFIEIKNRLNCSILDNAFLNMSVLLQPLSGKAEQETALMQIGPLTILPANYDVKQSALSGRMEDGLFVERALSAKLENNTGQYIRPTMRDQGNPATATQVNFDAIRQASLNKGAVNRFYAQLDCVFEEVFRRAVNANLVAEPSGYGPLASALKFQKQCIEDGVPEDCLRKVKFVRATRNTGNGSVFLRERIIDETMSLVPMMNEQGRQNWLDHAIAVKAGSENVEHWNPKTEPSPAIQNDQAIAMLENDALRNGSPVLVTSTQNPLVHATTHMTAATEAINSIPEGGDPMQVLAFLEAVGPHIAIHLQGMSADKTRAREFQMLSQQFKKLGQVADKLRSQLEQQQKQQQMEMERRRAAMEKQRQQTEAVMTDEELRRFEVQNKVALSREKADAQMEMKQQRHLQDLALKQQKANQELVIADTTAATDIRTKSAKAATDIAIKKQTSSDNNV